LVLVLVIDPKRKERIDYEDEEEDEDDSWRRISVRQT